VTGDAAAADRLTPWAIVKAGLLGGWAALRANAVPGLILWVVATAIVVGYYAVPALAEAMDALGAFKDRYGYGFSACSTAVFGAVLPWVVTRARLGPVGQGRWWFGLMLVGFWAYKGVEVDALYRFQAWLWGEGTDAWTIAAKTALDQLVYVPIWAVPSTVGFYRVERVNGDMRRWWRGMDGRWVAREMLPITVANIAVWVPAVIGVYLLPSPLQLPMQNLVLCLWSLMLIFMTDPARQVTPGEAMARGDNG